MARWKAAGRANRKDDDALWARFRGAQDRFFAARDADNAAIDAEYGANLEVKEALLAEAEALRGGGGDPRDHRAGGCAQRDLVVVALRGIEQLAPAGEQQAVGVGVEHQVDAALVELVAAYGPRIEGWRWGDAHQALHRHQTLGALPETVEVLASANIIKNVKSVIVPNTNGLRGIAAAAAAVVLAQAFVATPFLVIGLDLTVTLAASAGQLQLNVMEPVITYALFKSISTMENAVNSLRVNCVQGITANVEHSRDVVLNSLGIITVLKPLLGYKQCAEIARECHQSGKSLHEVVVNERQLLTEERWEEVFSFENLINPKFAN